ncbi:GTPase IMAP family member 1 [Trichomycterus rosablanca]|uniref:GTPase IMAP family member 1 n=1 Tax=Trichomycterus rosablanca TaxID=2290929 RepID=UPI002F354002
MMEENTVQDKAHEMEEKLESSCLRDPVKQERELRLVLLGWAGTGKGSMGNAILGSSGFETRSSPLEKPVTVQSEKRSANVAGRQVTVVDTPDWFFSESPPAEVQSQISFCKSLASPGPHAFLLCIPVNQPNELDLQTLDALEMVFGSEAIRKHTIILFTHTDQLSEGLTLQDCLKSERKDLREMLERCAGRYHVIKFRAETQEEEKEMQQSVTELLEKVDEITEKSGTEFYTCPPLMQSDSKVEEVEARVVEDVSAQILRRRRDSEEEVSEIEESDEKLVESTDGLEQEEDLNICPPGPPPTFFRWLWDTIVGWVLWLPSQIRGTTLLGSIIGLFFGGAMGATVGTVATEVERRKHKTKSK